MQAGKVLLVFVEDPPGEHRSMLPVDVLGARISVTPLVLSLVKRYGAELRWMNLSQQRASTDSEWSYRVDLRTVEDAAQKLDLQGWRELVASRLMTAWREDPAGYWWGRKRMKAVS